MKNYMEYLFHVVAHCQGDASPNCSSCSSVGGEEAVSVEHLPPAYNRWHSLLSLTAHHNESGLLSHLRAEEVGVFDYLPDARRAGRRSLVAISVPALQYDFYLAYIS